MARKPPKEQYRAAARLIRCLMDGPSSIKDMADESGFAEGTVRLHAHALQCEDVTRICGYEGRNPIYELNNDGLPNVAWKKASPAERQAAYRARKLQRVLAGSTTRKDAATTATLKKVNDENHAASLANQLAP